MICAFSNIALQFSGQGPISSTLNNSSGLVYNPMHIQKLTLGRLLSIILQNVASNCHIAAWSYHILLYMFWVSLLKYSHCWAPFVKIQNKFTQRIIQKNIVRMWRKDGKLQGDTEVVGNEQGSRLRNNICNQDLK